MVDINEERERLEKLEHDIQKAKDKADDLIEPHGTFEGGPGTVGDE
jgi:hypothetical protein